jgi:hypothetical protein
VGIFVVQAVTLYLFYRKLSDDRRKEEGDRKAAWEQFRPTKEAEVERDAKNLRMNTKRDVYMEMAPAIQKNSSFLTEYLRVAGPLPEIQNGVRKLARRFNRGLPMWCLSHPTTRWAQ